MKNLFRLFILYFFFVLSVNFVYADAFYEALYQAINIVFEEEPELKSVYLETNIKDCLKAYKADEFMEKLKQKKLDFPRDLDLCWGATLKSEKLCLPYGFCDRFEKKVFLIEEIKKHLKERDEFIASFRVKKDGYTAKITMFEPYFSEKDEVLLIFIVKKAAREVLLPTMKENPLGLDIEWIAVPSEYPDFFLFVFKALSRDKVKLESCLVSKRYEKHYYMNSGE